MSDRFQSDTSARMRRGAMEDLLLAIEERQANGRIETVPLR